MNAPARHPQFARVAALALCAIVLLPLPGCALAALAGGMAESYRRTGTRTVAAEYEGLQGHSVAVVVSVDRMILGTFPALATTLTNAITVRLADPANTGITGFVPPRAVLEFQYSNPDWTAWNYIDLVEEFGVDRLVYVDIYEFRLHEPGNAYLWEGVAVARVGVIEAESGLDSFTFVKDVQVGFPDGQGYGPQDFNEQTVRQALTGRLIDRVSWLMYEHKEPYYPNY